MSCTGRSIPAEKSRSDSLPPDYNNTNTRIHTHSCMCDQMGPNCQTPTIGDLFSFPFPGFILKQIKHMFEFSGKL